MRVYPSQAPTGPPSASAAPELRKRPVPIVPAMAIMAGVSELERSESEKPQHGSTAVLHTA